ncbi:Structural maintenance of chromosomes protein 4 [Oopsacas minuta]|uniref:Structural maintenance of chromosomes protein 4 n=1 Tax=Oopsacas minuta TaxID=111878 RepID=A0AAV7K6F9_9METZ|nr:Structural maintenance of chromosomes protein 4 [Oopsacas minuta]
MSQPDSPVSPDKESPPRLFITHIEAENFKSYAGKKTIGPFIQKFTCIIGPNGSGKSNVIDAVLFVFGYRARKIRSKKLSVLIHKSAEFPNFRSCKVTVYFQQIRDIADDQYEVIPGSDFQVSRIAHHDNTSEYFLSGTKATYREVTDLLRNYGIDLDHNRFLILQGEVESVALMKPKGQHEHDEGMLEYLEDIIGTADYKDTIEELFKEYEELLNARGEKVHRLKFVEKELSQLESAKEEAEQFLKQRDRVALSKYKLFHKNLFELKTGRGGVDENLEALIVAITKIEDQSEEQSNLVKAKQHDLKKKGKVLDKMKEAEESKTAALTECERRDVKAREDQKTVKSNLKSFNKTLEKERQKFEDLQTAPERLTKQIEEGEKTKVIIEKSLYIEDQKLEQIMSGLREATRDLQQEKEQKVSVLLQAKVKVNDAKSEQDMASTEYDLYMRQVRDHESQTKDKQFNLEDSQKKLQGMLQTYFSVIVILIILF